MLFVGDIYTVLTAKGQTLFRQMGTVRMHVFAHVIYIYKCVEFFPLVLSTQKTFFLDTR